MNGKYLSGQGNNMIININTIDRSRKKI